MFTIEHQFDASVVTLVDEGGSHLREDVAISVFEDEIVIEQFDAQRNATATVRMSMTQARDLQAALNLPEGAYRIGPSAET